MHVLIVNNTAIPAGGYGGTERVIWWLGKELRRLGHRVSYLVKPGSTCPFADVLEYDPAKPLNAQVPDDVDIVHMHFQTEEELKKPALFTHHGNFHPREEYAINTVFVSQNHARRNSASAYVYNGIDTEDYGPVDLNAQRRHLLFMGYAKRPEKNLRDCLTIARKTGNILVVAGGKPRWFKWRPWARYRGFLGGREKNEALQGAKALLFPVRWHEPFGLAVIESLYFGSPVFGSTYGSLPELITPDVGVVSNRRSELIDAVRHLDRFNRARCHEYVHDRFTARQMTQNYLALYQKVLSGRTLNDKRPVNGGNYTRGELLPMSDS